MKRPKDILSQPYHIQRYINYLERKNSSLHSVSGSFSAEQMKEAFKDGWRKEGELIDFDLNNYR